MTTLANAATGRSVLDAAGENAKWVWLQTMMDTTCPKAHKPPVWALKTLLALSNYMRADGTSAFPSAATLAKDIGCHRNTVVRDLSTLRAMHLLRTETRFKRGAQGYEYRPNLPDDAEVLEVARKWLGKVKKPRNTDDSTMDGAIGDNGTPRNTDDSTMDGAAIAPSMVHEKGKVEGHASLRSRSEKQASSARVRNGSKNTGNGSSSEKEAVAGPPEDWPERLAEYSKQYQEKPCKPGDIRKYCAPLIEKYGWKEVHDVWIGRFIHVMPRGGPWAFAKHYENLRTEGPTEEVKQTLRGIFGPLADMYEDHRKQVEEQVKVVRD
jgi:hypothetical protein